MGFQLLFPELVSLPDFWTINSITKIYKYHQTFQSQQGFFSHHPYLLGILMEMIWEWYGKWYAGILNHQQYHHLYIANWVIIYHLPPIKGTRNNHWYNWQKHSHQSWDDSPPLRGWHSTGGQTCLHRGWSVWCWCWSQGRMDFDLIGCVYYVCIC